MARPTGFLRGVFEDDDVATAIQKYESRYGGSALGGEDLRKSEYGTFVKLYFDLVTDFYEYGWGRHQHFATRAPNESFAASLARHEHYLAYKLGLRQGMLALDLGCGVGGPLREIVRFTGARVVGVNISAYQLDLARRYTEDAGLSHMADYVECDFMRMDFPDESFDAVFSIETTCCAPEKAAIFAEAFRVLKPGGRFGVYEYCLTDLFDPEDAHHQRLKGELELGGGLPELVYPEDVDAAMGDVGFGLMESGDLAVKDHPHVPWYQPLAGSGRSLTNFRASKAGRAVTHSLVWTLERLGIVPRGTLRVSSLLNMAAAAYAEAGQLGIFTPMYFALGRRPE